MIRINTFACAAQLRINEKGIQRLVPKIRGVVIDWTEPSSAEIWNSCWVINVVLGHGKVELPSDREDGESLLPKITGVAIHWTGLQSVIFWNRHWFQKLVPNGMVRDCHPTWWDFADAQMKMPSRERQWNCCPKSQEQLSIGRNLRPSLSETLCAEFDAQWHQKLRPDGMGLLANTMEF